eukprot:gene5525-5760_t
MDVVRYNAYGDLHDDLAAAAATGHEPVALVGLWGEFSLLNHRGMVVRAAKHITPGTEITISYLGAPQLLPLQQRRQALANSFGFDCTCSRQRQQLLSSVYPCLEVIADADSALQDTAAAAASLSRCLQAAAAVTPGSDLHVIVASKLADVQQSECGQASEVAAAAWRDCCEAHELRYGSLEEEQLRRLAELNRTLYL